MKKSLFIIAGTLLFFMNACKEIGPAIDFTPKDVDTAFKEREYDTSYMQQSVPDAQEKKMLVEDYTGVKCVNCPTGTKILKNYDEQHPNKIVIVGLHGGPLTTPIEGKSKYNFINSDVVNMLNGYLNDVPSGKPAAAFDRVKQNTGKIFIINSTHWLSMIGQRASATSPVNLTVASKYDTEFKKVVIKIKIEYTQAVAKKQSLTLMVTESKIIDAQEDDTGLIENYEHNHVLRDFITLNSGASILPNVSTKEAGLVYERQFIYEPKFLKDSGLDTWNLDNCHIVAVVHNDEIGDKEVAQVMETHLK